ncbi:MAG: hypothetical protein ACOVQA_05895 [Thermoflexibacteraceae bacterium]
MMKHFLLVFLLLLSLEEVQSQDYQKYVNTHYGFEIDCPSTLVGQGESDSKDGQRFETADKKAILWAYYDRSSNLIDDATDKQYTFEFYYKREIATQENRKVTYKVYKKDFFVISGMEGNKIFYRKTINTSNGWFTFELLYDQTLRTFYDKVCGRIATSFK